MPPKIKIIEDTEAIPIHKCEWVTKKGEPCPWKSVEQDKPYCSEHSKYEGIYTKEDIPNLTRCSSCKNLFKAIENRKTCEPCGIRSANNRKKAKENSTAKKCLKCVEIGKEEPVDALENDDYCGKHQSFKEWKELTDAGNIVCKNWIRGCFNIIDDDFKACEECRNKSQENKIINYNIKKERAFTFNNENDKKKMCYTCNEIIKKNELHNNKCKKCYETQLRSEANRTRNKK